MFQITSYQDHRDQIKSGDILVWSKDNISPLSNLYLRGIRFLTSSDYGHIAIAIRIFNRLFVLEATSPRVRLTPVSTKDELYHIPLNIKWNINYSYLLFEYIGLKYSILDATRAYFGRTLERDDRFQCVELAINFYKKIGIDFGTDYVPGKFVKNVLEITQKPIYFIKKQ